ncbi:MAG: polysaccharide deacetylase family protein [Bacteroidetes bacterium]|nr:polysaccharide deacetylase family protein [Bacteroidota bacterium]
MRRKCFKKVFTYCCLMLMVTQLTACNEQHSKTKVEPDSVATTQVTKPTLPDSVTKFIHKPPIYDSTKKYVYLTFDDGPQNGTTTVLDICRKEGIKGTFFMVGLHTDRANKGHELVNEIKNSYPQILLANHSYTHASDRYKYFYQHPQMAFNDFLQAQQTLAVPYKIIRLPGNSAWVRNNEIKASGLVKPVCKLLDSAGYNVIGWDVEWSFDHKTANPIQSPNKMLEYVEYAFAKNNLHTKNHVVILTHDRMFRLPEYAKELQTFITLLKQKGYVFETIDNYPNLKPF